MHFGIKCAKVGMTGKKEKEHMELVFHKTTIDDVEELSNVLKQNQYQGCEWSIPNLVLWAE